MKKLILWLVLCLIFIGNGAVFGNEEVDSKTINNLVKKLASTEREARDAATLELIKIGKPALPELEVALNSSNRQVAEFAAGIIGNIEDSSAVPALLVALRQKPPRRYAIVWALGKIKDESAAEDLLETLKDPEPGVKETAFRALIMMGTPAAPHILRRIKSADPEMRAHVISLLGELGVMNAEDEVIAALNDADAQVREAACRTLGYIGSAKSVEPLSKMLADPNWRVRINAINSLGVLGDPKVVPLLEKTLTDQRFIIREWSARALENVSGNRYQYLNEDNELVYPYNLYH